MSVPVLSPTNHPPLQIEVTGRVGYELSAVPGIAYMPMSDAPVIRKFSLRVLGQRSRVLDPNELKLPDSKDVTFKTTKAARGNGLDVTATFSPEFTKQLLADEKIPIQFGVPGASSAKVVCKIRR